MIFLTDLTKYQKQRYNSVFLLWWKDRLVLNMKKKSLKTGKTAYFVV